MPHERQPPTAVAAALPGLVSRVGGAPVAVGWVHPSGAGAVVLGAAETADFEIGSVSKGLTGMLYADAVARGDVSGATTAGELLPVLARSPVGALTLASLATHRSGLPRLAAGSRPLAGSVALLRRGTNPWQESLPDFLARARETPVGRPRPRYSNVGFQLLGHAVAAAAGAPYASLLQDRLVEPLALDSCYAPATPLELRATALTGAGRRGAVREPWTGEALGPAGGIRAGADAMTDLVEALLDGRAPGTAALDPVDRLAGPGVRIGAGWVVTERRGHRNGAITWHNGGTGGFRSWVGLARDRGCGVVVLAARSRSVDGEGLRLLDVLCDTAAPPVAGPPAG